MRPSAFTGGRFLLSAYQLPVWVWPAALITVCGLAVWRGGNYERLGVAGVLLAWALSMVAFKARTEGTQWAILAIDSSVFAVFMWIALRSGRYWPLFTAGFGLLSLATHFASAVDPKVSGWAYWTAERIWSYLILLSLAYAAWTAPYARRANIE